MVFFKRIIISCCFCYVIFSGLNPVVSYAASKQDKSFIGVIVSAVHVTNIPEFIDALGTLEAKTINLSAAVDGKLSKVYFKDGADVKKGQVIAQVDASQDSALLEKYKADLIAKQSMYNRYLSVKAEGAVSSADLDNKESAVLQAQAQVKQQQEIVDSYAVTAPFSGKLGNFNFHPGTVVSKGTTIVSLVDSKSMYVKYFVDNKYRDKIKLGQLVSITEDSKDGKAAVTGHVNYISPSVNSDTQLLNLKAQVVKNGHVISPGTSIRIKQLIGVSVNALVVPDEALLTDISGPYVYKINNNRQVSIAHISVGTHVAGMVQVLKGLNKDDLFVVAGQQKLNDGSYIKVVKEDDSWFKPISPQGEVITSKDTEVKLETSTVKDTAAGKDVRGSRNRLKK